jgi:transposase-like protein
MARPGSRSVRRYSDEFKRTAVRLSHQPGIQVKTVAATLAIHPFMLSKWRSEARDGRVAGRAQKAPPPGPRSVVNSGGAANDSTNVQPCGRTLALGHELL